MTRLIALLAVALAACASPSAEYIGAPAHRVMIAGREYRVFLRPSGPVTRAQVIRMGWAGGRDHAPILAAMVAAAEGASGCTALRERVTGDSGVLNLMLDCGDR
jgi:hypothetical protein